MPTNITDSDVYTATVQVPDDTEAANQSSLLLLGQPLANRTTNLKSRLDKAQQHARYKLTGTAVAPGGALTLTEQLDEGGFGIVSNEVQVPEAGIYLVSVSVNASNSDATDGARLRIILFVGATILDLTARRYSTTTTDDVGVSGAAVVSIATPASEKIRVEASSSGNTTVVLESRLSIVRIS